MLLFYNYKMSCTGPQSVCRQKLEGFLYGAYKSYEELVNDELQKLIQCRAETIREMKSIADELDERHHDTNIGKVVLSAIGVGGAVTGCAGIIGVGLALAPFTGGGSAVAAVGVIATIAAASGSGAAVLGTAGVVSTHIAKKVLEHLDLAKVQRTVDVDKSQCERVNNLFRKFENYCSCIVSTLELPDAGIFVCFFFFFFYL